MKVIFDRPPNFNDIAAVMPTAHGRNVIFAFHDAIYAPYVRDIPPAIIAHEQVHIERQGGTVQGAMDWWLNYLTDIRFRFEEELAAHTAEYNAMIGNNPNRGLRRSALKSVAKRLSGPLYGRMVSQKQAEDLISKGWYKQ